MHKKFFLAIILILTSLFSYTSDQELKRAADATADFSICPIQYPSRINAQLAEQAIAEAPSWVHKHIELWKNKEKRTQYPMTSLLITGPAKSGKTTLALAMARQCQLPCLNYPAILIKDYRSQDARTYVHQVFKTALAQKPCMVVIDALDALVYQKKTDATCDALLDACVEYAREPIFLVGTFQNNKMIPYLERRFPHRIELTQDYKFLKSVTTSKKHTLEIAAAQPTKKLKNEVSK